MSGINIFIVLWAGLLAGTSAASLIQASVGWGARRPPRVMLAHTCYLIGGASLSAWPMLRDAGAVYTTALIVGLFGLAMGSYLWGTMRQKLGDPAETSSRPT